MHGKKVQFEGFVLRQFFFNIFEKGLNDEVLHFIGYNVYSEEFRWSAADIKFRLVLVISKEITHKWATKTI